MIRTRALGAIGIVLAGAVVLPAASLPENSSSAAAAAHRAAFDQQTFWQTTKVYCDTCHFGPKARAKLNLESLDLANLGNNGETWEKVLRKLRSREMPPVGMPRPHGSDLSGAGLGDRGRTRSSGAGQAQSGTAHAPSPQPDGIRERRSRSAGAGDRRLGDVAGRRHRLRLRQYRRRVAGIARIAGTLSVGGTQDQPHRRRRHDATRVLSDLYRFLTGSFRTIV